MTAICWQIGHRLVEHEQGGQERAEYGKALLQRLAEDLTKRFGRGFGARNLYQMRQFRLVWTPERILQTVSAESGSSAMAPMPGHPAAGALSPAPGAVDLATAAKVFPLPWSAYVWLLSVTNPRARDFYETEALRNGWTVRQLDRQISSQFYERTALSRDKAAILAKGAVSLAVDQVGPEHEIGEDLWAQLVEIGRAVSPS